MGEPVVHARGVLCGGEYTLCGLAFDAHGSGDVDEPVLFAPPAGLVTCEECRKVIVYAGTFKRFRAARATCYARGVADGITGTPEVGR